MTPEELQKYWTPERIRELRKSRHETLEAFGKLFGFTHSKQRAWEIENGGAVSYRTLIVLEHLKEIV